ncbi:hypothetical protein CLOM_g18067 [Closterium sp. NIES-68]|nr:hypothetical protein CLOM_g18067 [Closterium sp. NIES-68]
MAAALASGMRAAAPLAGAFGQAGGWGSGGGGARAAPAAAKKPLGEVLKGGGAEKRGAGEWRKEGGRGKWRAEERRLEFHSRFLALLPSLPLLTLSFLLASTPPLLPNISLSCHVTSTTPHSVQTPFG